MDSLDESIANKNQTSIEAEKKNHKYSAAVDREAASPAPRAQEVS